MENLRNSFYSVYTIEELEKEMNSAHIHFNRNRTSKQNNVVNAEYNIVVSKRMNRDKIDNFFIRNNKITGFEA